MFEAADEFGRMSARCELIAPARGPLAARAQSSGREKGRLQKRFVPQKNDYRDAEATGHRT